jgi:hypothetical protein
MRKFGRVRASVFQSVVFQPRLNKLFSHSRKLSTVIEMRYYDIVLSCSCFASVYQSTFLRQMFQRAGFLISMTCRFMWVTEDVVTRLQRPPLLSRPRVQRVL